MFRTWISFTFSFSDLPSILKHVTNAHATNRSTKCLTLPNYSATLFFILIGLLQHHNSAFLRFRHNLKFPGLLTDLTSKQSHYHQELFTNPTSCSRSHRQGWPADFAPSFATLVHLAALLRSSAIPDSQLCTILMICAAFSLFERNTLHAKLDSQRPEIGWMTNIAPAHLCQHLCMFWKSFGTKSTSGLQHVVLTGSA